ncbi:MAG TPA: flagellar hook-basal body complex protein [Xanthobacteraceae bacterium]|nr:flagellar hook-basal body complex protein [Xanthobacteraceae bacterium]
MGIFDALTTAVAGLQAQSFALQNISGNIANSQTTGYKETNTAFQDLVSQASLGLQNPDGVTASSVATNTVQGSITSTTVATDMAINGDGFFVVAKPTGFADNQPTFSGINDYTRAGDFTMNANGNLVNSAGYYLMGIPVSATTGNPLGSVPEVLQFNNNFIPAVATTSVNYQANLPATPKSGVLNPSNFEANPISGAPAQAEIVGSGASLSPDAAAKGTGTVGSLTTSTTLSSLGMLTGDTISVGDGTNTTTYTVAAGDTINTLMTAINGGTAAVAASLSNGNFVLTGNGANAAVNTIDISSTSGVNGVGADATDLGFASGNTTFKPTNLLTQNAVAQGQTLTITVPAGGATTETLTFGTGAGQVETLAQLQTTLNGLATASGNLFTPTVNSANGDISIVATNTTDSIQIGGTASTSKFGITNLTAYPANGTVIANDVSTFDSESSDGGSITAYDSVGNPVNVQFRWAQVSSSSSGSTWQLFYQSNSAATGTAAAWQNVGTTFSFNANGEMSPQITSLTLPNLTVNGDNLGNVQLQIGTDGLTQFATTSGTVQVNNLQQNGYAAGSLQSVSVDSQNRVVGNFTNGQTIPLAEVTLASFNGTDALQALNGGAYAATPESGPPNYTATGSIEGSSLEASNVDIATQFSQLIVAQQAYSANARVMTTANQMIQSLLTVIQ